MCQLPNRPRFSAPEKDLRLWSSSRSNSRLRADRCEGKCLAIRRPTRCIARTAIASRRDRRDNNVLFRICSLAHMKRRASCIRQRPGEPSAIRGKRDSGWSTYSLSHTLKLTLHFRVQRTGTLACTGRSLQSSGLLRGSKDGQQSFRYSDR
jgi:hypothetical protein